MCSKFRLFTLNTLYIIYYTIYNILYIICSVCRLVNTAMTNNTHKSAIWLIVIYLWMKNVNTSTLSQNALFECTNMTHITLFLCMCMHRCIQIQWNPFQIRINGPRKFRIFRIVLHPDNFTQVSILRDHR